MLHLIYLDGAVPLAMKVMFFDWEQVKRFGDAYFG